MHKRYDALEAEISILKEKLSTLEMYIASHPGNKLEVVEENFLLKARLAEVEKERNFLKDQLLLHHQFVGNLGGEFADLHSSLEKAEKDRDLLREENAALQARLAEIEKERNCYISEWGQYSDLAHDLDCERAALEAEKADLKSKWERVREYLEFLVKHPSNSEAGCVSSITGALAILDEKEGR